MLYYNVLRKEREEDEITSQPISKPAKRELKLDTDLIEAFQGLPEYISKLHKRLDHLEEKVANPVKSR